MEQLLIACPSVTDPPKRLKGCKLFEEQIIRGGVEHIATNYLPNPLRRSGQLWFCTNFLSEVAFQWFSVFAGPAEPKSVPSVMTNKTTLKTHDNQRDVPIYICIYYI